MSTLQKVTCSNAIARLGVSGCEGIVLKRLDDPYQNEEMPLFSCLKNVEGEYHLVAATGDAHGYFYTRVLAKLTLFSRWRCIGIDINGARFVLYNPDRIAEDARRVTQRLRRGD